MKKLFTIALAFVLTLSSFGFGLNWDTNNVEASTLKESNLKENMKCVENNYTGSDLKINPLVNESNTEFEITPFVVDDWNNQCNIAWSRNYDTAIDEQLISQAKRLGSAAFGYTVGLALSGAMFGIGLSYLSTYIDVSPNDTVYITQYHYDCRYANGEFKNSFQVYELYSDKARKKKLTTIYN